MVRTQLTQRRLMDIFGRIIKKPKTIIPEDKLSAIYDLVNEPTVKFKKNIFIFQDETNHAGAKKQLI